MIEYQAGLDPAIKTFIYLALMIGPLTITGLVFLLKKIEKENPRRIRWK
tara:strand:+ start:42053 stop:42199 length:147 start_codon:yes stop_codon:yes gene_type:complete